MVQSKESTPSSTSSVTPSAITTVSKDIKLTPITAPVGKQLDLSGKVGITKADFKIENAPTAEEVGLPESDDRYKVFFRVKIGGVSSASQPQAAQPPASDAVTPEANQQTAGAAEYKVKSTLEGGASFYGQGDKFQGKKTANGEIFDTNKLTAAHKTLPFGTQVRVINPKNNKSVIVRINDRGPYIAGRIIDISYAAAKAIDIVAAGHAQVKVEVLEKASGSKDAAKPDSTTKDATKAASGTKDSATPASGLKDSTTPASTTKESGKTDSSKPESGKQDAKTPKAAPINQDAIAKSLLAPDSKTAIAALTPALTKSKVEPLPAKGDENLPDTPREFIFDSLQGDILTVGDTPYINLSSHQHSTAKFVIHDPDDSLRPQIAKLENVEIEAGFVNGFKINKFVGVIYTIGRRLPGGTEIEAIDTSAQLAQTSTTAVSAANVDPTANAAAPVAPATNATFKVKSTFTGDASFYGKGDSFNGKKTANGEIFDTNKFTAAHKTLPFGTIVRVTNSKNKKSVIVRINDRGPFVAGRIIDISYAAAQAIEMVASGHAAITAEVLDAPAGTEVNQGKSAAAPAASKPDAAKPEAKKPESGKPETKKPESTNPVPSKSGPLTPDKPAAQAAAPAPVQQGDSKDLTQLFTAAAPKQSLAKAFVQGTNLKIAPEKYKLEKEGAAVLQQSALAAAEQEAALQGKILVTRGNTVSVTAPGEGTPSGVILDYLGNRAAFAGQPVVTKRTNRQLQSGFGAIAVNFYNVNNKQVEGAVVNTPAPVMQHPTGVISAPDWKTIKIAEKIPGQGIYTWADATKNGSRVPASKEIIQGIIRIAAILERLTKESGQTKFTTNSWYRDPKSNRECNGASDSRHLYGDAVDFYFSGSGYVQLFQKLWADGPSGSGGWQGGVAKGNGFIHIDDRGSQGKGRSRWYYRGAR